MNYIDPSDCADDTQYEAYARQGGFTINSYRIGETSGTFTSVTSFANFLGASTPHPCRGRQAGFHGRTRNEVFGVDAADTEQRRAHDLYMRLRYNDCDVGIAFRGSL